MKHPRFRVRDVLAFDAETLDVLAEQVLAAASVLPFEPVDVEMVGSYVLGCASLHSDVDVNVAMRTPGEQEEARRLMRGAPRIAMLDALRPFAEASGLRFDIGAMDWRSRDYNAVVSLRERRLYGRDDGAPIVTSLRWSPDEQRFVRVPKRATSGTWDRDPFADEVEFWRARYGSAFIECAPAPDGRGVVEVGPWQS